MPAHLDSERLLRTLDAHGVECLVVGGVAAQLHGAQRLTEDLDLVARFDRHNLQRLAAAMRELNATVRAEGYLDDATREASKALVHEDHLARTEITTWNSDAGPFDILRNIPDATGELRDYEQLVEHSSDVGFGIVVRVADLRDIVASKIWANRPKDQQALPELRELLGHDNMPPTPARPAYPTTAGPEHEQDLEP